MKKYLLVLACACLTFAACDELGPGVYNDNNETPGLEQLPDISGGENKPTKELSPAQQQAKFQSVGQDVLTEFPAEAFENIAKIAEAFDKTYGYNDQYDSSELYEWMDNAANILYKETDQESSTEESYNHFRRVDLLLVLSSHTGLFTFGPDKVTVDTSYKGTKAVFTVEGKTYEAEIASSGETTKAYFKYEYHSESSYDSDYYHDESQHDHLYQVTVNVPEQIDITLTEEGNPLATITAKFNVNINPEHVQVSTDALAVEMTASINGYELKVSKTGYDGKSNKAQIMTTISKDGNVLITYVASADLDMTYEPVEGQYIYESEYSSHTEFWTATEIVVKKAENIKMALDIIGQIQIVGTCSNGDKLREEINNVWDALDGWDDETQTEQPADLGAAYKHTEELNKYIDFGVYYDKGTNKQADVKFEYYFELVEDEWGSWRRYGFYPIIIFNNGSQNKIEDFFTEKAFGNLIENMMQLGESYGDVFGYFMEKNEIVEDIH